MDIQELACILDSLNLESVSDEDFDSATTAAKDMTNLSNEQRLQLYGKTRPQSAPK